MKTSIDRSLLFITAMVPVTQGAINMANIKVANIVKSKSELSILSITGKIAIDENNKKPTMLNPDDHFPKRDLGRKLIFT